MQKKKLKDPFFHISQPSGKVQQANMQEFFSTKVAKKQSKAEPEAQMTKEKEIKKETKEEKLEEIKLNDIPENQVIEEIIDSDKATEIIENYEAEKVVEDESPFVSHFKRMPSPSFKRLKSFKEMDTLEKLNYLVEFPKQLPPVPCVFETEGGAFRGILVEKTEDAIKIKSFDGKTNTLKIPSIIEVRMIGLRKNN
ncbi:hypothetical protein F7731_06335 [Cytobacillus depressus]|uniref:Spore coat protein CotO n=1 Tax=Cytobacillus depressus TaxID=1602942 RepID=A0A6L3V9L9_9BACI|nr:CotO family spore coat protein [Cytobacillus depressus]KAB2337233.1 hypothetical protein F7731_06335 [Cytobacillus depressus]